jgi:hypothetical protein
MNTNADHPQFSVARFAGALALSFLVVACTAAGGSNLPGVSAAPGASAACGSSPASAAPGASAACGSAPSSPASGFYLRAWQSQALAPQYTFAGLPAATIAGGRYYNGMIAIPMIYPGPIYVGVSYQTISPKGIDEILTEARMDGLLGTKTDFAEQPMPGSITCHVLLVVDGVTHDLTGQCTSDAAPRSGAPGSSGAFAAFWNRLTNLWAWLGSELGPSVSYAPSSLAVLVTPPVEPGGSPLVPAEEPWPLATPFASFGSPMGSADYRCAVVSGADLAMLLPAVEAGNQLTRFVDGKAVKKSLQVRVLMPGEPSPC